MRINELLVEATEVELFRVLITRNLLILGTATTAKKAPFPDPLYVYCTKRFRFGIRQTDIAITVSHRFAGLDRETPSFLRYRPPALLFFGTPAPNFRLARHSGTIERVRSGPHPPILDGTSISLERDFVDSVLKTPFFSSYHRSILIQ